MRRLPGKAKRPRAEIVEASRRRNRARGWTHEDILDMAGKSIEPTTETPPAPPPKTA